MDHNLIFVVGLVVVPVLILMLLRINATMVFLGLCLGYVLTQFLGGDAKSFAQTFLGHTTISTSVMKLVLLLFPPVFTALFMVRTVRGTKLIINVLPALGVGCLLALLVVPLLPPGLSHSITNTSAWHQAVRLQDLIIGVSALASLMSLWLIRPRRNSEKAH
jgi:hypothetical protein